MPINKVHFTPHLADEFVASFHALEQTLLRKEKEIEKWFTAQWQLSPAPVYGSVDLRNSGFKLAPIDMNLFPAGFNNLKPEFLPLSVDAARAAIAHHHPHVKKIVVIPENHTRNLHYWDNIKIILSILSSAGFTVRLGSLLTTPSTVSLTSGEVFALEPITLQHNKIVVEEFVPDMILLNNDLSSGIPDILKNAQQPVMPPAELGWSQRLKSDHFQYYANVSETFAKLMDLDPWFISPLFLHGSEVNFMQREGEDYLADQTAHLLKVIQKKYDEYKIKSKPFVIIKADAGTYGMAVMTVRDAQEIYSLNRKERSRMSKSKSGQPVHRVIIQEGIYTFETCSNNAVAEPVVYLWGQRVVGGFYRVHKERGVDENLNTPGMQFKPFPFSETCYQADEYISDEGQHRFYAYGVIARLSMLAAAREILEQ